MFSSACLTILVAICCQPQLISGQVYNGYNVAVNFGNRLNTQVGNNIGNVFYPDNLRAGRRIDSFDSFNTNVDRDQLDIISKNLNYMKAGANTSLGSHTHPGRCPVTRNQRNIDVRRLMGIWYILERSNSLVPVDLCTTTNFTYIYDNVFQFIDGSQHYNDRNPLFKPQIGLCLFNTDYRISATMNCSIETLPGNPQFDIRILSTDYDTYCMMYVCQNNDDGTYTDLASLFSRTSYLTEASRRYLRQITCNNVGHCVQMDILDHNAQCGKISSEDDFNDDFDDKVDSITWS
ncbi:apolipoprotein D-like isoform X2 [Bradysia coprophila]|uniref:apolipoprotein D-like isoform X2 n=1 Tax=Bradysia coprophila TaxID=38358 RepID=UPI00187D7A8A|nr:apolipoprotein D-like isoform X2 [Bradysia coprophila]